MFMQAGMATCTGTTITAGPNGTMAAGTPCNLHQPTATAGQTAAISKAAARVNGSTRLIAAATSSFSGIGWAGRRATENSDPVVQVVADGFRADGRAGAVGGSEGHRAERWQMPHGPRVVQAGRTGGKAMPRISSARLQGAASVVAATMRMGLGAVLLLTAPVSAVAQQPTQAQANAIRQSCRSDYQSYCAGVPTGGSAALACLQQNASSVSQPCQHALAATGGGGTPPANPQAYGASPPGAAAAPGTVQSSPAPPDGTARPPLTPREQMAILRTDCGRDYRLFCRGVPLGGGRAIACLRANGRQLSPQCQSALLAMRQAR